MRAHSCPLVGCAACGIMTFCAPCDDPRDQYHPVPVAHLPDVYAFTAEQTNDLASMGVIELYVRPPAGSELGAPPQTRRQAMAPAVSCTPVVPNIGEHESEEEYNNTLRSQQRLHLHHELIYPTKEDQVNS